jgi:hyperosmotically inducible periplasmic protein
MKRAIMVCLLIAAAGCDKSGTNESGKNPATAEQTAADNTDKNERDRKPGALTPGDQSESEGDRTITQQIRQGVVAADALSVTAKNVKIITVDGVVTLRGPVKTPEEKTSIATIAKAAPGVKKVENQLEVAVN